MNGEIHRMAFAYHHHHRCWSRVESAGRDRNNSLEPVRFPEKNNGSSVVHHRRSLTSLRCSSSCSSVFC